jgi:DNA repair protein RadC
LEATEADKAIHYDFFEAGSAIDLPVSDYLIYRRMGIYSLREMKAYINNAPNNGYTTVPTI